MPLYFRFLWRKVIPLLAGYKCESSSMVLALARYVILRCHKYFAISMSTRFVFYNMDEICFKWSARKGLYS